MYTKILGTFVTQTKNKQVPAQAYMYLHVPLPYTTTVPDMYVHTTTTAATKTTAIVKERERLTYSPDSEPIHMVANLEEGRSLSEFCRSAGTGFLRAFDRPHREKNA